MLAEIERQCFRSMDDKSLIWACVEPTIREIRGRDMSIKSEAHGRLNRGQQASISEDPKWPV
jgi:hypothetical protein